MSAADDALARLHAWRRDGADAADPVRFACIAALARRAAAAQDDVRRLLDARLAERVDAYAADLARERHANADRPRPASALAALRAQLDAHARERHAGDADAAHGPLDEVRRASVQARRESQLRQALEPAPGDAGPLNSARLVHRALRLMQDVSPGYLQAFMAYVDTLAALDARPPGDDAAGRTTSAGAADAKRRVRARGRTRG